MASDHNTMTDEDLMACIQNGDHGAFSTLVRRHTKMFYAAAYRMCSSADESEDIVQEAFLKLWRNPKAWEPGRGVKFTTWFYRVVTNQALDHVRKKKPSAGGDVIDLVRDDREDQLSEIQNREEQDALESAIQRLPERQKAALNLCFYEGLSNKDAAEILGVGIKALESLLMRAKASLKEELTHKGFLGGVSGKEHKYG